MAINPNSIEFNIIFLATVAVVVFKASMIIYLSAKLRKKKGQNAFASPFILAMIILFLCLFLSRISYMVFDFYYTKFDTSLYADEPGIWYWKLGMLFAGTGLFYLTFITDKKILNFKFKGLFAYIVLGGSLFVFLYPINTIEDFEFVSSISIAPMLGILVVFLVFLNIAIKTSGEVRKTAVILILAFIFYAFSGLVVNAGLISAINSALGSEVDVFMYLLQTALKIAGITFMGWGGLRWG